jgi:hypothetical protein
MERVVLRDVVPTRTDVGDHDEPSDTLGDRRVDSTDGRVPVDGIRPLRTSATGTGRPHDDVAASHQGTSGRLVQVLDVCHDRRGASRLDVGHVLGVAHHGPDVVTACCQQRGSQQGHLPVSSDDHDSHP